MDGSIEGISIPSINQFKKLVKTDANSSDLQIVYDGIEELQNVPLTNKVQLLTKSAMETSCARPTRKRKALTVFIDEPDERNTKMKLTPMLNNNRRLSKGKKKRKSSGKKPFRLFNAKCKDNDIEVVDVIKKAPAKRAIGSGVVKKTTVKKVSRPTKKTTFLDDSDIEIVFEWDPAKVVSEEQGVEEWQARNILQLFDQENTLPFIARYRKEKTGNLDVEKIREIQNKYSQIKIVREKVTKVIKNESENKCTVETKAALLKATTLQEVEHLTVSLKKSSKKTYAEKARLLGLDTVATSIFEGKTGNYTIRKDFLEFQNNLKEGLRTEEEIEQGIIYIIADIVSKHPNVLELARTLMRNTSPKLECSKKVVATKSEKNDSKKPKISKKAEPSTEVSDNYKNYFDRTFFAWSTRPHQVMAINRGEKQNVLRVKIVIHDSARRQFINFCQSKWASYLPPNHYQSQLIMQSIEDSWERLVKPYMQRHIRSQLTERAEIASVEVFTANLKKLLLIPPLRGKTVLAIDPGLRNGCKIGVTNVKGETLMTTTIYPFKNYGSPGTDWENDHDALTLREIVNKYNCEYIAIGNGTACRQTEQYLSSLIKCKYFGENRDIQYTIVNESGASQYSVSPEALAEFPGMDPNHISAVSLARRIQDPLLEYVKVPPIHLGVGMYQHDISEKLLSASLDSVMTECVSFVGVDLNVASEFVLRKLSGLSKTQASNIVKYRNEKGPFMNREQIRLVKGVGPKTFEQCAGFIKIIPSTIQEHLVKTPKSKLKSKKTNDKICPFDQTMIHPESYKLTNDILNLIEINAQDVGKEEFISKVRNFCQKNSIEALSKKLETSLQCIQLIFEGLTQPLQFDMRAQFSKPVFRSGVMSLNEIKVGTRLTGTVRNMTHFGAFVDVGVGDDGLIHVSKMNGMRIELGNNVEVTVHSLDKAAKRIGLFLERVL